MKKPAFNWIRQRPHKIVAWLQSHEKTASWATAGFTGLICVVTAVYAVVAFFQWRAVNQQVVAMNTTVQQTKALIEQQKEGLGYAKTQADAAKTQADASTVQANVSEQMVKQNERLVKSGESQANTSQVSARAAKESAGIARQVYETGLEPHIYFIGTKMKEEIAVNKKPMIQLSLGNSGKKAGGMEAEMAIAFKPRSFEGLLPGGYFVPHEFMQPLEQNETTTMTIDFNLQPSEVQLKAITEGDYLLIFYGWLSYKDVRDTPYSIPLCYFYSRTIYPDLAVCPTTIRVPGPASRNK